MDVVWFIFTLLNVWCGFMIMVMSGDGAYLSFVNPIVIYRNVKINWFATILLTIVLNIIFAPLAALYWFYKLCTVGRK